MNGERHESAGHEPEARSGLEARRNFLKASGSYAVAAPAVVLLLSTADVNAQATDVYSSTSTGSSSGTQPNRPPSPPSRSPLPGDPPPKKNLLDP